MTNTAITAIDLTEMGKMARTAARQLARTTTEQKDAALLAIAERLDSEAERILAVNEAEVTNARARQIGEALLDRLSLKGRLGGIADDVRNVAKLPDPVGEVIEQQTLATGLRVSRRRTPIGVLGIIYEARPNVTVDVAALAIKSGNAVILRGGSEMIRSATVLVAVIREALTASGLPADAVQLIEDTDRHYIGELLKLHEYVDLIIPRGGAALHKFCRENSMIPVITGGIGICHLYVDADVDAEMALNVIDNAKTQRPSPCNALDTILVHEAVAPTFIPRVVERLGSKDVSFRADPAARTLVHDERVTIAGPNDWDTEWMSLVLGIRVVDGVDTAIEHIQAHSMGHSDGILTRNMALAEYFINQVDSSAVFVNASTRLNDGGQLGLGAEIAVSTQKVHARGPMGLRELTSYKWVIEGEGHIRT